MADRVIVANSIPTVEMEDGSLGIQMRGEFTITNAVGDSAVQFENAADTNSTFLEADDDRAGFRIFNTCPQALFIKYGAEATETSFTVRLPQYAYLEENSYRGQVDGVWESGASTGGAAITDLTSETA